MIKSKDVMANSPRESSLIGLLPRVSSSSQGEEETTWGTTPSYFYRSVGAKAKKGGTAPLYVLRRQKEGFKFKFLCKLT